MSRAFLKNLIPVLIVILVCSGCKQENIIGNSFSYVEDSRPEAVKYKNGAVLVKSYDKYSTTNRNNSVNPESGIGDIKFGPKNINFDN